MKVKAQLVLAFVGLVSVHASPVRDNKDDDLVHYDQRQNGTENYRVNVDGVLVAIAPAEPVLAAVASSDINELLELLDYGDGDVPSLKPTSSTTIKTIEDNEVLKPKPDKSTKKSLRRRLADFLIPILRRTRHH